MELVLIIGEKVRLVIHAERIGLNIATRIHKGGWPKASIFKCRSVVLQMVEDDTPLIIILKNLTLAGVGLVCVHYAVEVPKGAPEHDEKWLGGYFEVFVASLIDR